VYYFYLDPGSRYINKTTMSKYKKDDLEKMVILENKTYKEIGKFYNVSGVYVRKLCIKMGIKIPDRAKRKNSINKNKTRKIYFCINCGKETYKMSKAIPKFCSRKCNGLYTKKRNIEYWLNNQDEFKNILMNHSQGYIKNYLLKEQENKCNICKISDIWNNKKMTLILDHIDGDASNNRKNNLRLICHNCDSQLPTYKSKNKNSARVNRYKK
jgi:hypothetical protein